MTYAIKPVYNIRYSLDRNQVSYKNKDKAPCPCGKESYPICYIAKHDYSVYFLTITHALCPPKPNVLLNAARTVRCCALLNVKFKL